MTDYQKFLPEVTALHQPFWDSLRRHETVLQRCDTCGTFRFIPTEICHHCHGHRATWTPISGKGQLYTYTVVHRGPTPAYQAEAPYIIGHVTMAEGPRMISRVLCAPDAIRIGMPVRIDYDDVTPDLTLYQFQPEK